MNELGVKKMIEYSEINNFVKINHKLSKDRKMPTFCDN